MKHSQIKKHRVLVLTGIALCGAGLVLAAWHGHAVGSILASVAGFVLAVGVVSAD